LEKLAHARLDRLGQPAGDDDERFGSRHVMCWPGSSSLRLNLTRLNKGPATEKGAAGSATPPMGDSATT
jgi:hypothetical protein